MRLVKRGKVKDIYEANDEFLIFHFTDRISAFDIIMNETIPFKGKVLCDFALFWFSKLNIENHFVKKIAYVNCVHLSEIEFHTNFHDDSLHRKIHIALAIF